MTPEHGDEMVAARGELLLYRTEDGRNRVECRFDDETLWLSQAAMMELHGTTRANTSMHLKSIFEDGEFGGGGSC